MQASVIDEALRIIDKVIEIHNQPSTWCKYTLARDEYGNPVNPTNPTVVSFCLTGVVYKAFELNAAYDLGGVLACKLLSTCISLCGVGLDNIGEWNDDQNRMFGDILAIERCVRSELLKMREAECYIK